MSAAGYAHIRDYREWCQFLEVQFQRRWKIHFAKKTKHARQNVNYIGRYRRAVFDDRIDFILKTICLEIQERYQMKFLEIGTDKDHVHFLVQSIPTYSVTKIVTIIKSLTAREIFKRCPFVKKTLWGGEFWTDGYFVSTVGKHGDENMIGKYVKNQGGKYQKLHTDHQLLLF